jgi:hypothetical protein
MKQATSYHPQPFNSYLFFKTRDPCHFRQGNYADASGILTDTGIHAGVITECKNLYFDVLYRTST